MNLLIPHDLNPFSPLLDEIALHGENVAPIPVASAFEDGQWAIDVDVRIVRRTSFDFVSQDDTFHGAMKKAIHRLKRELPKC